MPNDHSTSTVAYKEFARGYRVGDDGAIWSSHRQGQGDNLSTEWHPIRLHPNKDGHLQANLRINRRTVRRYAHQLVLEAFVGPCPPGLQCRHLDGNPANNRLDNLKWGTQKENAEDAVRHGVTAARVQRGSRNVGAKLTEEDIPEIRRLRREGWTLVRIGRRFGVCDSLVCSILKGKKWAHV